MVRSFMIATIGGASLFTAMELDSVPQFLGAALGAFVAVLVRNDKQRTQNAIEDALMKHEHSCRMRKES